MDKERRSYEDICEKGKSRIQVKARVSHNEWFRTRECQTDEVAEQRYYRCTDVVAGRRFVVRPLMSL